MSVVELVRNQTSFGRSPLALLCKRLEFCFWERFFGLKRGLCLYSEVVSLSPGLPRIAATLGNDVQISFYSD